jgi:hypothetical protein
MSEQNNYAEHYDATQGKGLCWSGCGRKVYKYRVRLNNGKMYTGESMWCLECNIESGEIIDAREIVV